MAIKVKHDGNVTSRIYASAAGGKGKRQAEDAIKLAQLQASAQGRGGGGGGGGASAHAPTTSAPTAHAQLGSPGSLVSPQMSPETRMRLADDALNNQLIEQDFTAGIRAAEQERQGEITLTNRLAEMDKAAEIANNRELTAQGQRELSAMREDFIKNIKNFKPEELPELYESFGFAEDQIKMLDALRENKPTLAEQIKKNTDENGIVWSPDGTKILYNPLAEQAAAEQKNRDFELRKAELEAKRRDAEESRRLKFISDLMKPVKIGKDKEYNDIIRQLSYEEAEAEAKKAFPKLYAQQPPAPKQPYTYLGSQNLLDVYADIQKNGWPKPPSPSSSTAAPIGAVPAPVTPTGQQIQPLPENATPEQAQSYADQFKRKHK